MKALRKGGNMPLGPSLHNPDESNDAWWDTYRLHWLEEAVKHQVPEDVALSKGRHVPDKEVGEHSEWRGEDNPGKRKDGTNLMQFKAWKMLLIWVFLGEIAVTTASGSLLCLTLDDKHPHPAILGYFRLF